MRAALRAKRLLRPLVRRGTAMLEEPEIIQLNIQHFEALLKLPALRQQRPRIMELLTEAEKHNWRRPAAASAAPIISHGEAPFVGSVPLKFVVAGLCPPRRCTLGPSLTAAGVEIVLPARSPAIHDDTRSRNDRGLSAPPIKPVKMARDNRPASWPVNAPASAGDFDGWRCRGLPASAGSLTAGCRTTRSAVVLAMKSPGPPRLRSHAGFGGNRGKTPGSLRIARQAFCGCEQSLSAGDVLGDPTAVPQAGH